MSKLYGKNGRLYLDLIERQAFIDAVLKSDDLEAQCLCLILVYTGCRLTEALNLTIGDIETKKHIISFGTLKQRDDEPVRPLWIPEHLTARLIEFMKTLKGKSLFPFSRWTARRRIKVYMEQAGLSGYKASSRGLRRAYGIGNSVSGVPVADIKKWYGHKKLESTEIYIEYDNPNERALAAKGWPENLNLPSQKMTFTPVKTETEFFSFEGQDLMEQSKKMNSYIKSKEAEGWFVSKTEHVKNYREGVDQEFLESKGMFLFFALHPNAHHLTI